MLIGSNSGAKRALGGKFPVLRPFGARSAPVLRPFTAQTLRALRTRHLPVLYPKIPPPKPPPLLHLWQENLLSAVFNSLSLSLSHRLFLPKVSICLRPCLSVSSSLPKSVAHPQAVSWRLSDTARLRLARIDRRMCIVFLASLLQLAFSCTRGHASLNSRVRVRKQ